MKDLIPLEIRERAEIHSPQAAPKDRAILIRLIDEQLVPEIERLRREEELTNQAFETKHQNVLSAETEIERLRSGVRRIIQDCGNCAGQGFEYADDGTGEDVVAEPCENCFDLCELTGDHTNYWAERATEKTAALPTEGLIDVTVQDAEGNVEVRKFTLSEEPQEPALQLQFACDNCHTIPCKCGKLRADRWPNDAPQLPTEGRDTEIVSPVREEHFGKPV